MTLRGFVAGALTLAALAAPGAGSAAAETGAEAFARRDYAGAAARWREEAAGGSARAKLGLGLISDLGLGAPRDPAEALRWYREAGDAGLAEAQFNAAVMLDAGLAGARDVAAASVWYARAAANGNGRAQYNLGLLYAAGEGVPRNADLARHWLGRAAPGLPAARQRLAALAPAAAPERTLAAPEPLGGAVVTDVGARRAELVWTAPPAPPGARFVVEVARLPAGAAAPVAVVARSATEASALVADLPPGAGDFAWRVSLVDPAAARYAASAWTGLAPSDAAATRSGAPRGGVVLHVAASDAPAARLARELAASFAAGGLWTRVALDAAPAAETRVRYVYAEDADLAASIADFLPVLGPGDAEQATDPDAAPGEVGVWLVGGPNE